jgi:hypothetical protein
MGILTGTTHGDAANALMAIYQEQARFAGHATQGSRRIPIHLLPSERLQRHRDRQAGQDSAAEIRPGMALTPAYIASERFLLPERNWRSFVVVATAHRSCFALERLFVLLLLPTSGLP